MREREKQSRDESANEQKREKRGTLTYIYIGYKGEYIRERE